MAHAISPDANLMRLDARDAYARERRNIARSIRPAMNRMHGRMRAVRLEKARAIATHTVDQWSALVAEFSSRCVHCGSRGRVTRDHITPISIGGSDGIDNIQPPCASCNSRKGIETINWAAYRREYGFDEDIA